MSTELSLQEMGLAPSKYSDDKAFSEMSSGGFLPRLMLFQASSELVKQGKASMACYGIVRGKDQVDDLSKETDLLVLAWRPKALEISAEEIISVYNPNSADFKRIATQSEVKDSGCMFGPEFLVWIPSLKLFASFFMSSKTSRREAPALKGLIGKKAKLRSTFIKGTKYSWFGPVVTMCSSDFEFPTIEEIRDTVTKFNNPPENESEAAPDTASRDR